jgi:hypothetical protein
MIRYFVLPIRRTEHSNDVRSRDKVNAFMIRQISRRKIRGFAGLRKDHSALLQCQWRTAIGSDQPLLVDTESDTTHTQ